MPFAKNLQIKTSN